MAGVVVGGTVQRMSRWAGMGNQQPKKIKPIHKIVEGRRGRRWSGAAFAMFVGNLVTKQEVAVGEIKGHEFAAGSGLRCLIEGVHSIP